MHNTAAAAHSYVIVTYVSKNITCTTPQLPHDSCERCHVRSFIQNKEYNAHNTAAAAHSYSYCHVHSFIRINKYNAQHRSCRTTHVSVVTYLASYKIRNITRTTPQHSYAYCHMRSFILIKKHNAHNTAAAAQVEAEKCAVIATEVSEKQANCERDLAAAEPLVAQAEAALDTLNEKVCVYTCVCVVSCNLVVAEPLVVAQAEAALDTLNKKVCVCICVCCKLQPGCC